MMAQQLHADILAAPLATFDRRALSQAWYSALHLAHCRPSPATAMARTAGVQATSGELRATGANRFKRSCARGAGKTRITGRATAPSNEGALERRSPRSQLARSIERVFLDRCSRPTRTAVTLRVGSARVIVLVQSTNRGPALIAVCRRSDRDAVARALAHARFALASLGLALGSAETKVLPCS